MAPRKRKAASSTSTKSDKNHADDHLQEHVISILKSSSRILVLAGAGISVSCGIPDFRSAGTGLYHTLDAKELGLDSPEDLFDLESFTENPQSFYKFAKNLYPGSVKPSLTHEFISLLHKNNKLLRIYTQNIDGLEEIAGVPSKKVVYAHGSLTVAKCLKCNMKIDPISILSEVKLGIVPRCTAPSRAAKRKEVLKRKALSSPEKLETSSVLHPEPIPCSPQRITRRTSKTSLDKGNEEVDSNLICNGLIKPGVTMFGEKLDCKVGKALESDRLKVDAVIVMGTSLSVAPMSKVLRFLPPSVPRILINRNEVVLPKMCADEIYSDDEEDTREGYLFDHMLLGNCDNVVKELITRLEWESTKIKSRLSKKRKRKRKPSNAFHVVNQRCYAFSGAIIADKCQESDIEYLPDIVHCDGCQKEIQDGVVMKCIKCFDFDLCRKCFPKQSKIHFKGKHNFKKEVR